jgi:hypothetical protein
VITVILLAFLLLATVFGTRALYRIWKRRDEFALGTKLAAVALAAFAISCLFGVVVGLLSAFGAMGGEVLDPSQKARILTEDISGLMNGMDLGVLVGVPSSILLYVLTRPRKRSKP